MASERSRDLKRTREEPPLRPSLPKNIFSSLHTPPPIVCTAPPSHFVLFLFLFLPFALVCAPATPPHPQKTNWKKKKRPPRFGMDSVNEGCVLEKWYKVECRIWNRQHNKSYVWLTTQLTAVSLSHHFTFWLLFFLFSHSRKQKSCCRRSSQPPHQTDNMNSR